jgi:signal transduction histidine kinase
VITRSATDRVVAGVAGGLGERFGVDPVVVRLAFVVLAVAGGFGILLYLFLWLLSGEPATTDSVREGSFEVHKSIAIGLIVAGMLMLLREVGMWFGDALVWPVGLGAFGSAVIWTRSDDTGRAKWTRLASRLPGNTSELLSAGEVSPLRIVGGGLLITAGLATFLAANDAFNAMRNVIVAIAVTLAGAVLILGPWMLRLGRQLAEERRERIRSQERAVMAAHLHDSVLQTLALIQRSKTPDEVAALARGQERELRAWLYGKTPLDGQDSLAAAIDHTAADVERLHNVTIETVTVGDCPMTEGLRALVDACREAMVNAAHHSGSTSMSVYVEVGPERVEAFVRDQGRGFDLALVPPDREGIAGSISGRMERYGGTATVVSSVGAGTEVHLTIERER